MQPEDGFSFGTVALRESGFIVEFGTDRGGG